MASSHLLTNPDANGTWFYFPQCTSLMSNCDFFVKLVTSTSHQSYKERFKQGKPI